MIKFTSAPLLTMLTLALILPTQAQNTLTWNGGSTGGSGNSIWSRSANWGGVGIPSATNDVLVFDGTSRLTNSNDLVGVSARSITYAATAGGFTFSGNAITLGESGSGITNTLVDNSPNPQHLNFGITLGTDQTWVSNDVGGVAASSINNNGFNLTLSSSGTGQAYALTGISGTGGLTVTGNAFLSGTNSYTGLTTVSSTGSLSLTGSIAGSVTANGVLAMRGGGSVGGNITVDAGGTLDPTGMALPTPVVTGNVLFQNGGTYQWNLIFPVDQSTGTPGIHWSDIIVQNSSNFTATNGVVTITPAGGSTTDPNGGDSFWTSNHQWIIADLNTGTLNYSGLTISNPIFNTGTFSLTNIGNDLYLNFDVVPEPQSILMLVGGLGLLGLAILRRH